MSDANRQLYDALQQNDWAKASDLINTGGAKPDETMLMLAVTDLDAYWVEKLLEAGARPTSDMLHEATVRKNESTAGLLMNAGAKPHWKTTHYAHKNLDPEWSQFLSDGISTVKDFDDVDDKVFYEAVLKGDLQEANILIDSHVVPGPKSLGLALVHLDTNWLKMMLDAGAVMLDAGSEANTDMLEYAVHNLPADKVELLVNAGVEPTLDMLRDAICTDGVQDWDTAQVLMKAGLKPDQDMLDFAVDKLSAEWVERLIEAGVEATPKMLFRAVCGDGTQDWDTAKVLVDAGKVVPDTETLGFAVNNLHANWVAMLLQAGGKPTSEMLYNSVCVEGVQDWSTAEVLVRNGAVPDADTMQYARDNLDPRWMTMLNRRAGENYVASVTNPAGIKTLTEKGPLKTITVTKRPRI